MKCVYGRAGVRYVITKFCRMDSLPNFVTHGAPLRALRARELRYYNIGGVFQQFARYTMRYQESNLHLDLYSPLTSANNLNLDLLFSILTLLFLS